MLTLTPQLVLDINPTTQSSSPTQLTAIGSLSYFIADDGIHAQELWKSDGTATGTTLVKDIYPGSGWVYTPASTAARIMSRTARTPAT